MLNKQLKDFEPRTVRLADIYKQTAKKSDLPPSVKAQMARALERSGFDSKRLDKIIHDNEAMSITEARRVASSLNAAGVQGFSASAKKVIDFVVRQQAVKTRNLDRVRQERMLEDVSQPLSNGKNASGASRPVKLPF